MDKLEILANQRASETGSSPEVWVKVLSEAREWFTLIEISENEFEILSSACVDSDHYLRIVRILYGQSKMNPGRSSLLGSLLVRVDESDFELSQWLLAVDEVYTWLKKSDRSSNFATVVGYVHCSTMTNDAKGMVGDLRIIVQEMLDEHGFERATDAKYSPCAQNS